jgi:hypothetical protein
MAPNTRLTLKQKIAIIEEKANGSKTSELCKMYNVVRSSIMRILKKEQEIKSFAQTRNAKKVKRISVVKYHELQTTLYAWFQQKRAEGFVVNRATLQRQALLFARRMEIPSFKASNGWLQRMIDRLGMRSLAVCGEILDSVEDGEVLNFVSCLSNYIEEQSLLPCQVYNCDETGLFYKQIQKKTLVSRSEKNAPGRKSCKQRITLQLCCNASGDNKVRIMVIGRSKKPRCFAQNHFAVNEFVHYEANKTAWMTSTLFERWFHQEFVPSVRAYSLKMGIEPKAILVLDNASSHPKEIASDDDLIKVMFLPSKSTPVLQPMDIGIIRPLKAMYSSELLRKITNMNSIQGNLSDLTLDKVILMIHKAWNNVKTSTIINAFGRLLGGAEHILQNLPDPPDHFGVDDSIPLFHLIPNRNYEVQDHMDIELNGKLYIFTFVRSLF